MSGESIKNWHRHCLLPDGTELQEHSIKTNRDIVVGEFCQIDYGLRGADVYVGESTKIREYVWAEGDARIGNLCEIGSDVIAKQDAYIGEGVKIAGRLVVSGTLDIGENVEIGQGFEATGEIAVRNPMPVLIFILIYLMTMLKIENERELDRILDNLFTEDEGKVEVPLMIPARSRLNMKVFSVPSSMKIGRKCRFMEISGLVQSISLREPLFSAACDRGVRSALRVVSQFTEMSRATVRCTLKKAPTFSVI